VVAVNTERSRNEDLARGSTERKYKEEAPDRGGRVDHATLRARRELDASTLYGYVGEIVLVDRQLPTEI
jgi:hypothetical protein